MNPTTQLIQIQEQNKFLAPATQIVVEQEKEIEVKFKKIKAEITMYSSEVGQTDDTPFTTANGEQVKDGGIACPIKYKFGTKVEINNKIYSCNDRMGIRYQNTEHFDIWSASKQQALSFGRKQMTIKVYE